MPFTLNGFGTSYYGLSDFLPDGSFVTTEWITALYIPLIPLASYRLSFVPGSNVYAVVFNSRSYRVVGRLPVHRRQMWGVYKFIAFCVPWIGGGLAVSAYSGMNELLGLVQVLLFLLMLLMFAVPVIVYRRIRKRQRHRFEEMLASFASGPQTSCRLQM